MISYIYMLLITVVLFLGQGIYKEQTEFFQVAKQRININMRYDYLYTVIQYAREHNLCDNSKCISGQVVKLSDYKMDDAKVCKTVDGHYYAFFSDFVLEQKPITSMPDNKNGLKVVPVTDIPVVCGPPSGSSYGLYFN
ncbi:hypothetical protein AAEU23_004720 [Escherichia coli]|nr:hypothetical protein [Escherichia coli]